MSKFPSIFNECILLSLAADITCRDVVDIENGYFNYTVDLKNSFGSIVEFFCNDGYQLLGSKRIVCTANDMWSDVAPVCAREF